ncbi:VanZ family protein [methanotrophic bacterial endosymbiont of Bathymodiolus sp.]|jgi:VanZ family protein|nr:VanZ family protein [methanotrophic bacterial endosymbiont of Bathymodiolus sp.]
MTGYYSKAFDSTQLILYCVLIYWFSDQSALPAPELFRHQDKVVHAGAYFVMAAFALRAFRHFTSSRSILILSTLIFCSLYGLSDEWHQSFVPGRMSDVADWVADTVSAMLFLGVYCLYRSKYASFKQIPPHNQ